MIRGTTPTMLYATIFFISVIKKDRSNILIRYLYQQLDKKVGFLYGRFYDRLVNFVIACCFVWTLLQMPI